MPIKMLIFPTGFPFLKLKDSALSRSPHNHSPFHMPEDTHSTMPQMATCKVYVHAYMQNAHENNIANYLYLQIHGQDILISTDQKFSSCTQHSEWMQASTLIGDHVVARITNLH